MNGNVTLVPALLTALRDIDADRINPEGSGARGVEVTVSVSPVHGLDGAGLGAPLQ